MRGRPDPRRLRPRVFAGMAVLAFLLFSWVPTAVAASAVSDGGFESGSLPVTGPGAPIPLSFGQWSARTADSHLVSAPVHAGSWSAEIDTRASTQGSYVLQDFDSGDQSYVWTFWWRATEGTNFPEVIYGWDRTCCATATGSFLFSEPTALRFTGWGAPQVVLAPLTTDVWHEVRVVADRCTAVQDLYIDGTLQASVLGVGPLPSGTATMLLGDLAGSARHGLYHYDDVSFELFDCSAPRPCPLSHGYWKNHAASWPVASLDLGDETYGQAALLDLLRTAPRGDASRILAQQLIAAKLNVEAGADPAPVAAALAEADGLLAPYSGLLPYHVRPSSPEGRAMLAVKDVLDDYNNGLLTPGCMGASGVPGLPRDEGTRPERLPTIPAGTGGTGPRKGGVPLSANDPIWI